MGIAGPGFPGPVRCWQASVVVAFEGLGRLGLGLPLAGVGLGLGYYGYSSYY